MEKVKLYDVPKGSEVYFPEDPSKEHFFVRKIDGMYAQLFRTEEDMLNFNQPGFVAAWEEVVIVKKGAAPSM